MGSDRHRPEGALYALVRVDGFWIDRTEVTNAQFAKFVAATGYVTLAERGGDPKIHVNMPKQFLEPGSVVFIMPTDVSRGGSVTQWFQYISGANWRHPEGPNTSIAGRDNHPVVHVAYEDALAYARWLGAVYPPRRNGNTQRGVVATAKTTGAAPSTPTANRSPTPGKAFSPSSIPRRRLRRHRTCRCFKPNGYGLYDMIGNVWEWTSDWYRPGHRRYPPSNHRDPAWWTFASRRDSSPVKSSKADPTCARRTTVRATGRPHDSRRKSISAQLTLASERCAILLAGARASQGISRPVSLWSPFHSGS